MRNVVQPRILRCPLLAALPLFAAVFFAAAAVGCKGSAGGGPTGSGGTAGGGGTSGTGGLVGPGGGGAAGMTGTPAACTGASDPRLVVASQRILRLTLTETVNTVRYLIDNTEATALLASGLFGGDTVEKNRLFPPLQEFTIIGDEYKTLNNIAEHVGAYVLTNFATLAACATPTDACATAYLNKLAAKAYRRQLTAAEQTRFTGLYNNLRNQMMNGYQVTTSIPEAVSYAVQALLSSPQMLWRWEIGNPAMASAAPAGIPLTDAELATHLSFFLTDQPPDDMLLSAASSGTLRTNLAAHVNRILATQPAKDWLRTIIETYYLINQLPGVGIDNAKFPLFSPRLVADLRIEVQKFLDSALWSGNLTDLLLSRKAFLNDGLASSIYLVPVPAGATATNFVETTLPADQRSGILTNAAFITSRGRSDGRGLVIPRGKAIAAAILCTPPDPPPDAIGPAVEAAKGRFETQTAQEQVKSRQVVPLCNSCHGQFDAYGLVLDYYDNIARYRTLDDLNMPVDGRTTMPAALGGEPVSNAIEVAQKLAASPAFTNCMAKTLLQYAMVDFSAPVELPLPPQKAGCAAADVVQKYQSGGGKTFTDLVRATAATPAFVLRHAAP
ncbi:MAG: DUF1592 domain-containing protein [Pseudomonadota bacterium]